MRKQLRANLENATTPDAAVVGLELIELHELETSMAAAREELEATLARVLTSDQKSWLAPLEVVNGQPVDLYDWTWLSPCDRRVIEKFDLGELDGVMDELISQ